MLNQAATLWISDPIEIYEGASRLPNPSLMATRLSLPSDRSFESYDAALAHIAGSRLPHDTNLYWDQPMLDVWLDYDIHSDKSRFSIPSGTWTPGLARGNRAAICAS